MQTMARPNDPDATGLTRLMRKRARGAPNNDSLECAKRNSTINYQPTLSIDGLPTKLVEDILYALGVSPVHLVRCMSVSRQWREIAASDSMWQRICTLRWPSSRLSPVLVATAGGPRAFFRQRQMTITLINSHTQAMADHCAGEVLAANGRAAADYVWMIDLIHTGGTVLFSQVIEADTIDWSTNFPVVTETELTDADGGCLQFNTIASMITELYVSINVIRRSDNKMLCVANNQRLRQETIDSESESDLGDFTGSEVAVADMLNVISVDCPINSDYFIRTPAYSAANAYGQQMPGQMSARLELDGTDPASEGQVTAALLLLSGGDYATLSEYVEVMKAAPWL